MSQNDSPDHLPDDVPDIPVLSINENIFNEAGALYVARSRKAFLVAIWSLIIGLSCDMGSDRGPVVTTVITSALYGMRTYFQRKLRSGIAENERNAKKFPEEFSAALQEQKSKMIGMGKEDEDLELIEGIFEEMAENYDQ